MEDTSNDPLLELNSLLLGVQENLDQELSLRSLARQSGYSPFHFHRKFFDAVGETPKQHVHRQRLERAAYKLAITDETILEIAFSVGFKSHETFSRAFKRGFGYTPKGYRHACKVAQVERLERNRDFRGVGCVLSDVRFVTLPAATFLAVRRHGAYAECPVPFQENDTYWNELVDWADQNQVPYQPLALAISYDDPTVTPLALQRLDACIPIGQRAATEGKFRQLKFVGGRYCGIEHAGPLATIDQAYRNVADGIRRSQRYVFHEGPPTQIYRRIHLGGDPSANLTEVYFPVRAAGKA